MQFFSLGIVALALISALAAMADDLDAVSNNVGECPITVGTDELLGPESGKLYGSAALAVVLPQEGNWGVTRPGARIAVKLFWLSAGFRPGMEQHLTVKLTNLNGGPNDAVVKGTTSANSVADDVDSAQFDDEWMNGWAMLTGIDFPSPGCWQITGDYLGQSLSFVVEIVDHANARTES